MIPIPDLLNREPFLGIDQKALSDLLGLAILGREIGTEFHDLMAEAETPEAAWRPEFFEQDLFVDRLIEESFELRIDGVHYPINERFLRRALTATPTDLETIEFRQGVLREMDEDVMLYELKHDLNAYLAERRPDLSLRTLADIIEFNERHAEAAMPYFGQDWFLAAEEKGGLDEPAYRAALKAVKRLSGPEGIDAALADHRLDCLLAPTIGAAWSIDLVNGDHRTPCSSSPAALAGYPSVTVPAGFLHGLPVGVSFFAGADQDAKLIGFAYAFERMTQIHRPPETAS